MSQNVQAFLSGLCCQNIPPSARGALHCKAGECGTVAWSRAWGSGGFGAGLALCKDGVEAASGLRGLVTLRLGCRAMPKHRG